MERRPLRPHTSISTTTSTTTSAAPPTSATMTTTTRVLWEEITFDDFESGWGSFADGGGDAARRVNQDLDYIHQGVAGIRIRDNSGVASSMYQDSDNNVADYSELRVSFWFKAKSMDNSNEDFFLEYSSNGGSSWSIVEQVGSTALIFRTKSSTTQPLYSPLCQIKQEFVSDVMPAEIKTWSSLTRCCLKAIDLPLRY